MAAPLVVAVDGSNSARISRGQFESLRFFVVQEAVGDPPRAAAKPLVLSVPSGVAALFVVSNQTRQRLAVRVDGQLSLPPVIAAGQILTLTTDGSDVMAAVTLPPVARTDETSLDHNLLSGLDRGNPHPQYATRAEVAAALAELDAPVSEPAAPLTDAQTLEGFDADYFLNRENHRGALAPEAISPQGHGSTLDSDTVDGFHADAFALRSDFDELKAKLKTAAGWNAGFSGTYVDHTLGRHTDVDTTNGTTGQALVLGADGIWRPGTVATSGGVSSIAADANPQLTGDVTFSSGSGITLTQIGQNIEVAATGGGGGNAPDSAQYLTLALNGTLTNERVFTPGHGLDATDGGANSTYTVDVDETEFTYSLILAGLLTVDGAGSGLDADLFDGLDSTAFSLAAHDHDTVYLRLDTTNDPLTGDLNVGTNDITGILSLEGTGEAAVNGGNSVNLRINASPATTHTADNSYRGIVVDSNLTSISDGAFAAAILSATQNITMDGSVASPALAGYIMGGASYTPQTGIQLVNTGTNPAIALVFADFTRWENTANSSDKVLPFSYVSTPAFNGTGNASGGLTVLDYYGLYLNPRLSDAGGGAVNVLEDMTAVFCQGADTVPSGWTVEMRRGLHFKEWATSGSGSILEEVAVDIETLHGSSLQLSLRSTSSTVEMRHAGPVTFGANAAPTSGFVLDVRGKGRFTDDVDMVNNDVRAIRGLYGGGVTTGVLLLAQDEQTTQTSGSRSILIDGEFTSQTDGVYSSLNVCPGIGGSTATFDSVKFSGLAVLAVSSNNYIFKGTNSAPLISAVGFGTNGVSESSIELQCGTTNFLNAFLFTNRQTFKAINGAAQKLVTSTMNDEPTFRVLNAGSSMELHAGGFISQPHFPATTGGSTGTVTGTEGVDGYVHYGATMQAYEAGWSMNERVGFGWASPTVVGGTVGAEYVLKTRSIDIAHPTAFLAAAGSRWLIHCDDPTGVISHVGDTVLGEIDGTPDAKLDVRGDDTAQVTLRVTAETAQTADLLRLYDSTGVLGLSYDPANAVLDFEDWSIISNISTIQGGGSNLLIIGGSAATSTLRLRSTGAVGTTDAVIIQGGNSGGTEIAKFNGTGGVKITSGALDMNTHLINNVVDPVSAQDAATKNYVDSLSAAPSTVAYVTIGNTASLSAERALTAGTAIGITDGGANSTVTIAVNDAELLAIAGLASAADKLPYFTGSGTAALADLSSNMRTFMTTPSSANLATLVTDDLFRLDDAELGAIAGLVSAANKFPYFTGSGTAALADLSANMRTFLTTSSSANLAALVTDDTFQLNDAELGAIAGLTSAADKFPYFTGSGTAALADLSSAMRTFMTTPSSANFAALVTDETGTAGKVVFDTTPVFVTNITAPLVKGSSSASADITIRSTSDTTKGLVKIADDGGHITIGGGTAASELRFLEPSGGGGSYTGFKAPALGGNVMYTLPTGDAGTTGQVLQSDAAGALSWSARTFQAVSVGSTVGTAVNSVTDVATATASVTQDNATARAILIHCQAAINNASGAAKTYTLTLYRKIGAGAAAALSPAMTANTNHANGLVSGYSLNWVDITASGATTYEYSLRIKSSNATATQTADTTIDVILQGAA